MSEFVEYLNEVFEAFGSIHARKMFGGYGIYHDDIMFGLVANDTLYFKSDNNTKHHFEERGLSAFEYNKGDKIITMSYHQAPDDIFDDPELAQIWAQRAYDVACNTIKPKTKKT